LHYTKSFITRCTFLVFAIALSACGGGGGGAIPASQTAGPGGVPALASLPTSSPAGSPTPLPSAPPQTQSFSAPAHVLTGDYLGRPDGTKAIAWSAAAPHLTWAQTGIKDGAAISAAGIKTQFYIDAARTQSNDALYTSNEDTFAHDCSGNRVTDNYHGITQYVMNLSSGQYAQLFAQRVDYALRYAHFDAIFSDDSGPLSTYQEEHPFSALPCGYSDSAWLASGVAFQQASAIPVLFNGLHEVDVHTHAISPSVGLLQSVNALGGNFEQCYGSASQPKERGWFWKDTEQTELLVAAQHKIFECMVQDPSDAAASADRRIYTYASFLLTYDPQSSVFWETYRTTSGFHVEPESQLVPLSPRVTAISDVSTLVQPGGAYAREYTACYLAGRSVGACAVVVNPTDASVPFPFTQYHHTLQLSGGGIVDGGTVTTSGPAPSTVLAPLQGAIVFQ
jgi:hypothetical protein